MINRNTKTTATRIIVLAVVMFIVVFYFIFDPLDSAYMPQCLFYKLTGLQCVGCGSQRMLHSLLHGDLAGAFWANAFALLSLPVIGFLLWLEFKRNSYPLLYRRVFSKAFIVVVIVLFVGWFVARNWLLRS